MKPASPEDELNVELNVVQVTQRGTTWVWVFDDASRAEFEADAAAVADRQGFCAVVRRAVLGEGE